MNSNVLYIRKAFFNCRMNVFSNIVALFNDILLLTVRILFSDKNRTLTHEEVSAVTDSIISKLNEKSINLKA